MVKRLNIEDEKSLGKACAVMSAGVLFAFFSFVVLSIFSFAVIHFFVFGADQNNAHLFEHNAWMILSQPTYFFVMYASWWNVFTQAVRAFQLDLVLCIPLFAPILSFGTLFYVFMRSSYSFSLWYVLNHHFAKVQDVQKMGLLQGILLVLGRFQGHVLGMCRPASVLCLGETGCGKTSTVAIPSILRSDNINVVAIDNTGTLAKYTSGYRSTLGPTFYFNWDMEDNPDKKEIYPRWNPLAAENLPPRGPERDGYIRFLASYMVSAEGHVDKGNYWDWLASGVLATFMGFLSAKCAQAISNDYFLGKIIDNGHLSKEDKDILASYYALMPKNYSFRAIQNINKNKMTVDDYFPIGSWEGIPSSWQGKDLCLAMLTDWLLKNYLSAKDDSGSDDWRHWLEMLLAEATLFDYGAGIIKGLQQFLFLSKQQRQLVFAYVLKPLKVFLNQGLRERTCGNDLVMRNLRGVKNPQTKKWEPVTVYSSANTKTSKFVGRMFVEVLLNYSVFGTRGKGALPMLIVFDDAGQMLKIRGLAETVAKGPMEKVSFLLLCNSLNAMERTYGRETLENMVANTSYKIIMADNSSKMSRQLDKLAIFASRSVQIPLDKRRILSSKRYFTDANYFHRLASELKVKGSLKIETRGYQLLLAEGYYHWPILTSHVHFLRDGKFKDKAMLEAQYFLDETFVARRNVQDIKVPHIEEVLYDTDMGIDDEVELNQYMNDVYDDAKKQMPQNQDFEDVMLDDISLKWRKIGDNPQALKDACETSWWMSESAFEENQKQKSQNPFALKK